MAQVCHLIGGVYKRMAICCQSSCKWLLHVRRCATAYFTFLSMLSNVVKCCQMLSKKQPWQTPLTFEKNPWHLTKNPSQKKNAFEAVGFQPQADSGALVQSRFQIKNQKENNWSLYDFLTITLYSRISNLHAPGSGATVPSNGSVSMCFFFMGRYTSQHPLKPEESQNGSIIFLEQNFRKLTSKHDPREAGARRPLNFSPPKEEMNGEEVWQMHKLTLILVHTAPMHLDKLHAPKKAWKTS